MTVVRVKLNISAGKIFMKRKQNDILVGYGYRNVFNLKQVNIIFLNSVIDTHNHFDFD